MDNDDVIDTLNKLIETSKDGEYGFRACAEHATAAELKAAFAQHAEECLKGARELQTCVVKLGGKPDERTAAGSRCAARSPATPTRPCSRNASAARTWPWRATATRWRSRCPRT